MDPISAMPAAFSPELRSFALPKGSMEGLQGVPYQELGNLGSLPSPIAAPTSGFSRPTGSSFDNLLGKMVAEVGGKQAAAGDAVASMLAGGNVPLHQAMIAAEEASLSFQLMVEVRNKLLEAYHEMMRMQV